MPASARLQDQTAIITGAARGVGRACALAFAEQGADLLLADIAHDLPEVPYPLGSESQLLLTERLCRERGAVTVACAMDVRSAADVERMTVTALDRFGRIDVLVNSAGIAAPAGKLVHDVSEADWLLMLDIDLSGAWRTTKAVGPVMVRQGGGSIINIASSAGLVGYRYFAPYVAAKHGLIGLSRAAALDYAQHQVRVNALCPGSIRDDPQMEGRMLTEIARALDVSSYGHDLFADSQPMGALIEPDEVAQAAVWLASEESRHVTGSVLSLDGGYTAR